MSKVLAALAQTYATAIEAFKNVYSLELLDLPAVLFVGR
jgi:hypothetical protein